MIKDTSHNFDIEDHLIDKSVPSYSSLFEEKTSNNKEIEKKESSLKNDSFTMPQTFVQKDNQLFSNKNYYKAILNGEGQSATELHNTLAAFLQEKDPQLKQNLRFRLITKYWNLFEHIVIKNSFKGSKPKQMAIRFGALLPNIISKEQRALLGSIIDKKLYDEPILYLDEWLSLVIEGEVSPLVTDEIKPIKQKGNQKLKNQLNKSKGNKDAHHHTLLALQQERRLKEKKVSQILSNLEKHQINDRFPELERLYSEQQTRDLQDILQTIRELSQINRDMNQHYKQFLSAYNDYSDHKAKAEQNGDIETVDNTTMRSEVESLKQMIKICVGRQGNHIPILMKNFFSSQISQVSTRENVIAYLKEIEEIDPSLFYRTFKQKTNRIVPYIILLPCYGDFGMCWEPFERFNRATSRGRVGIPIFSKNYKQALLYGLADLRWQVAKEKAQHYWMEEGLTGKYYQYFSDNKLRGDVRIKFIEDYILWITKESQGVQKLEREARGVFWRNIPFPQKIKDRLRNRGFVYSELYKKDMNRASSDGY